MSEKQYTASSIQALEGRTRENASLNVYRRCRRKRSSPFGIRSGG